MSQEVRPDAPTAYAPTVEAARVPSPSGIPEAEYRPPAGYGSSGRYRSIDASAPTAHVARPVAPPAAPAPGAYAPAGEAPAGYGPSGYGPTASGYGPTAAGYDPTAAGYGAPVPPPARPTEGTAVAALVCGFLAAPVGVVLGIVALRRIKRRGSGGKGLAVAGIVIGALSTLAVVASTLAFVALVHSGAAGSSTTSCSNDVCQTTVYGTPISIDEVGGETLGRTFTVVAVAEGSAQVQGDPGTPPITVQAGETFDVDDQPVTLMSAQGGEAVFRYRH